MEYGLRLTRHVLAQVFGNLPEALRLSLVPGLLIAVVGYWAMSGNPGMSGAPIGYDPATGDPGMPALPPAPGRFLLLAVVGLLAFSWIAVSWHRYVLIEDRPGIVPAFVPGRVLGYVGRSILIALAVFVVLVPVSFVLFGLLASGGAPLAFFLGLGANFLAQWLFVRLSLILPASAVDRPMKLRESWQATRDVSGEILVPIIGLALVFTIVQQLIAALPGGFVVFLLVLAVYWLQMLLNLSLLTTLYGNRIEGRELN